MKQGVAGYADGEGRARAQVSLKHLFVAMPFHFKNGSGEEGGLLAARIPEDTSMEAVTSMEAAIDVEAVAAFSVEPAIGMKDEIDLK